MKVTELSDAEMRDALQLKMDGYSTPFIAARYDVGESSMNRALVKYGRTPTRGHPNDRKDPWRCLMPISRWEPDCMTPAEFELWNMDRNYFRRPCDACPLAWSIQMRMEGRCNGIPGVLEEAA